MTVPSMLYTTPTWFADNIIPRLRPLWHEKKLSMLRRGCLGTRLVYRAWEQAQSLGRWLIYGGWEKASLRSWEG